MKKKQLPQKERLGLTIPSDIKKEFMKMAADEHREPAGQFIYLVKQEELKRKSKN